MGYFLDRFDWEIWVYLIIPFSVIGAVLMLTLWNQTPRKNREMMQRKKF